jgi:RNA polymerase sigma-70 factor (ECF subfamily)
MFSPGVAGADEGASQILTLTGGSSPEPGAPQELFGERQFCSCIKPYLTSMLSVARGITGSRDLAWDAVQEALLTLWLEKEPPFDLRRWLVRTVVHRSLHAARTRRRCQFHEQRASAAVRELDGDEDPERVLVKKELVDEVSSAFASLSRKQRAVLTMHGIREMKYVEIASALDVPVGTVRSRLNRARAALRALLETDAAAAS